MIRRSKEQWLSLFQQQTESGLSAAEFCKQHELCDKYFSLRKKQLLTANFLPVIVKPKQEKRVSIKNNITEQPMILLDCKDAEIIDHFRLQNTKQAEYNSQCTADSLI